MAAKKIKKGDEVIVIAGKDKGRRGEVKHCLPNDRLVVGGVNIIKRHTRPNPQLQRQGGIIEKEASIHVSNVALYNSQTRKADRVGFKILESGKKVRYFKSTDEVIDV